MGFREKLKNFVDKNNEEIDDSEIERSCHDVYISYSTKDKDVAFMICYVLEMNDVKCWIAPRNITSMQHYADDIADAIKSAKTVVLVFSENSDNSKFVNNEIEQAFNLNKPIIVFKIDDYYPHQPMDFYLKNQKHITSYPDPKEKLEELVKLVFSYLYGYTEPEPEPKTEPLRPYHGEGKYIFVSYVDEDCELVFPDIRKFQDLGYNVWYDDSSPNEKNNHIPRLKDCDLFVVFVTNNSMASIDIQKEIKYAVKYNKKIIPIYLEDFDEIEMEDDIDFELSFIQGILKITLNEEEYIFKFTEALQRFGFEVPKK